MVEYLLSSKFIIRRKQINIPKMSETRSDVIIIDKFVEIKWSSATIGCYTLLGYEYTGYLDRFLVDVDDLSHGSGVRVSVQCPVCRETRSVIYSSIFKMGHTLCKTCCGLNDLNGLRFGKLTVVGMAGQLGRNSSMFWSCVCDCGNTKTIDGASLVRGHSTSCGCYLKNLRGKEHFNWKDKVTHNERLSQRSTRENKDWVRSVLERDGFVCQICGITDNLEVHHLYSYKHYPEYRFDLANGVTMCEKDHKDFHGWMGGYRVRCVPSDIDRWLYSVS